MFRHMQDLYGGKLRMKYTCRFPRCWRRYYQQIGSVETYFVNVHFYKFPREPAVLQQWKDICRVSNEDGLYSIHICEYHFLERDFVNSLRHRLNRGVVPKHLEIVPYNISTQCAGYLGVSSHAASSEEAVPENSNQNEGDTVLDSEFLHDSLSCSSMSSDETAPYTSTNKEREVAKSHLSDTESHMHEVHRNILVRLVKLKKSLADERDKLKILKNLYEENEFNVIEESLNMISLSFMKYQLRNIQRVPPERRWTAEDKVFALSVYKQSPRLYRYLAVVFSLPSVRLLKFRLSNVPLEPGLSPVTLEVLKSEIMKMRSPDKYCCLLLDEVALDKGLHYESDKQTICGYEDLGHLGRSSKKANRALVFMLRGILKNWKQVIAYYFTTNAISRANLKVLICHIISEIQKLGLKILCTVSDLAPTIQKALKELCEENVTKPSGFYFFVNGRPIAVVFDVPHLLKYTRDALIKHKIEFAPQKEAKFEYIEQAFNFDQDKMFKILTKLKKEYFNLEDSFIKMKVNVAAAQMSHTVAAVIEILITHVLPSEAMNTADFIDMIDNLFDSLNSSEHFPHDYKKFRCAVSTESPHVKMWCDILKEMANWKIIELATGEDKTHMFSFLKGWQTTIKSIKFMWFRLKKHGFIYLNTRAFNQDPLENLLCCIRLFGNTKPTCFQFKAALKTAILNNMVLPSKDLSHCEDDGCSPLNNLRQFVSDSASCQTTDGNIESFGSCDIWGNVSTDKQTLAYMARCILQRIDVGATIECDECKNSLFSTDFLQATHLVHPSEIFILLLQHIRDQLYSFLDTCGHTSPLVDHFVSIFKLPENIMFCTKHAIHTEVLKRCVPFFIYKYIRDSTKANCEKRKSTIGHDEKVKQLRTE